MNKKTRIWTLLLAMIMLFSITACKQGAQGIQGEKGENISKCLTSASIVCNGQPGHNHNYIGGIAGMNNEAMIEYCLFVGATGGKYVTASNAVAGTTSTANASQKKCYKSSSVTILGARQ